MQDLLGAGVHFGHKVSRAHPRMKQYIFGARDGVSIIDLAQSESMLKEACDKMYELGRDGKTVLLVGTKKQAKEIIREWAEKTQLPFLAERWFGGLLTNFEEVKKNIKKLSTLKDEQSQGKLTRYTKREQLLISKKLIKFDREMGGVVKLESLPDAIFVIDAVAEKTAVREANNKGILLIGLADSNADPTLFNYPVAANDDGIKSIKIVTDALFEFFLKGKEEAGVTAQKALKKAEEDKATEEAAAASAKVLEEAAVLEEIVEKKIVAESDAKK